MSKVSRWVGLHRHTLIGLTGVAVGAAVNAGLATNPWVNLGIAAATVLGIYTVPNKTVPIDG
jgi:hypothetical protein